MRSRRNIPTGGARVQAGREAIVDFEVATTEPTQAFFRHMRTHYPMRTRRLRKDIEWWRKQAIKYNTDPDRAVRSL